MAQSTQSRLLYWIVFLASTVALILAVYTHWPWLTMILPFQLTAFVKAMDIM